MTTNRGKLNDHEEFSELSALELSGTLTDDERARLHDHLSGCSDCREVYRQYRTLDRDGIPMLAAGLPERWVEDWDDRESRAKLFARVRVAEDHYRCKPSVRSFAPLRWRVPMKHVARAVLAACIIFAAGVLTYRQGARSAADVTLVQVSAAEEPFKKLVAEKNLLDNLLYAQKQKLTQLNEESVRREQELLNLRSDLQTLSGHASELLAARNSSEEQLQDVLQQRDALNGQLRDADHAFQRVQGELAALRTERDKALLMTASLESRIDELSVIKRVQDQRLRNDEEYLASDRDIRELMGARKLYIADVFDVDSGSRTRKPFGRVFYTQGKSLLFYAFDLDREPGLKNASAFQAWGRKGAAEGEDGDLMSLGILYIDSESNRRWVLRCDDPRQLSELEAVFVTVEPHGGSRKPTSKPFLYAMLRKEVNHP